MVQSEEITQPPARPRNKRISSSIQQQQQHPSSSTPNPKRARVIDTTIEDHDPNISEVNSPQNVSSINTPNAGYSNQHPCEKCQKLFPSKYLMKKHSKDCLGPNSQEPIEGKSKCDGCGEYFTTQGGWLTRVSFIYFILFLDFQLKFFFGLIKNEVKYSLISSFFVA